jgi:predicted transcriptional regulator
VDPQDVHYLTDDDEALVESLPAAGVRETEARVLVFLVHNAGATVREIERGTDMNQPQLSKTVSWLEHWAGLCPVGKRARTISGSFPGMDVECVCCRNRAGDCGDGGP